MDATPLQLSEPAYTARLRRPTGCARTGPHAFIATEQLDRMSDFYAFMFAGERAKGLTREGWPKCATLRMGDAAGLLTVLERRGARRRRPVVVEVEDEAALTRVYRRLVCFVAADGAIQHDDDRCWLTFHDPDGPAVAVVARPAGGP